MGETMKIYFKTLFVVLIILVVNYLLYLHPLVTIDAASLEIFFNLFGVIYAIIIGFAIYLVLDNYNEIKYYMNCEVNELQDLRDFLMYVDNQKETNQEILQNIRKYAQSVVEVEWPAMCAYKSVDFDTPEPIYAIMKSVNKIQVNNESDKDALAKLIQNIADITTHRTNRLTASVDRLPSLFKHLIIMLSVVVVFSFTMIPIQNFWVNMGLNAVNSFGIALIYFIINDLDYPFGGVWSLQPTPFQDFLKKLETFRLPD